MSNATTCKILYADDDPDDCIFLSESVASGGLNADMVCVSNGEDAILYLQCSAVSNSLPSLIVLDLNMPRFNGIQTLQYLKSQPRFSSIPVMILSTSDNSHEQALCAGSGAVSCHTKPRHFNGYRTLVQSFVPYINSSCSIAS